jgi:hypothetical protein
MKLRKTSAVAAVIGAGATAVVGALITAAPASALQPTSLYAQPNLSLSTGFPGNKLTATLTSNGSPVAGRTIVFTAGGLGQCTGVTNAQGVASCFAQAGGSTVIVNGGYNANFNGDAVYAPSYDRGTFIG